MKKTELYPLQFVPQYKARLWGGNKFNTLFNRNAEGHQLGESWEISGLKKMPSIVLNGSFKEQSLCSLIEAFPEAVLGKKVLERFGQNFPLLIKFIDAKAPLSVQVHPNDSLAKARHKSFGKNEMWYVLEAETSAELILGFKNKLTKERFSHLQAEASLEKELHTEKVKKGDVVSVPAGLLHAIGGGILLAEIQQASDITYRVYDYDRVDEKTGAKRELHQELALDAIDFSLEKQGVVPYGQKTNHPNRLVKTPYFTTAFLPLDGLYSMDYSNRDAFSVLICVEGKLSVTANDHSLSLEKGQCVLIPAALNEVVFQGKAQLLDVTV